MSPLIFDWNRMVGGRLKRQAVSDQQLKAHRNTMTTIFPAQVSFSPYTGCHKYVPIEIRLNKAILDVINNPKKTQRTTDFGTLFLQTL